MNRVRTGVQLLVGWLPMTLLFATMMIAVHGGDVATATHIAIRMVFLAAVLGFGVHRLTARWPWPHPFQLRFLARHVIAAAVFSMCWFVLNSVVESLRIGRIAIVVGPGLVPYLTMGVWIYVMIAGVAYALRAAERAAALEVLHAQSQLAALRAQVHPHFLFNALHTVVQLIPIDPDAAVRAAEQLGEALRIAIDERRDRISLREELAFVQRYLAIEKLRFGERLRLRIDVDDGAAGSELPTFALQTLVENAVRHGVAPSLTPVDVLVTARDDAGTLTVSVLDTGVGTDLTSGAKRAGTGLHRLREQLAQLYGTAATLMLSSRPGEGFRAALTIPQSRDSAARGSAATMR
jgi:hypothetical protein